MNGESFRVELLRKMLDVTSLRHKIIAQNVANVNTPGYHRLEVSFEDRLEEQLRSGGPEAVRATQPQVAEARGGTERLDGNNVDIDQEMGDLSKNALLHNLYSQVMSSHVNHMRLAIAGR